MSGAKPLLDAFADQAATGAGLNLLRTGQRLALAGDGTAAGALLARASRNGKFAGEFDDVEREALRNLSDGYEPMDMKRYVSQAIASSNMPLILNQSTFPRRMASRGFVPLRGQNLNNPGLTLKEFTGDTRQNFIDDGAENLIAAINIDPAAAAEYAKFYARTQKQLEATGIPIQQVGGAWATLSAQADPTWNAELLRRILNDPMGRHASLEDQVLALKFLAGDVGEGLAQLGGGKRRNFFQNSTDASDPNYLTADTRYAQNMQGVMNTYKTAPFAGLFNPQSPARYQNIYIEPGLEAARRLGILPNELQAGSWGNWRKNFAGLDVDLADDLLDDLAGFPYDPDVYREALTRWTPQLATEKAARSLRSAENRAAKKAAALAA
jgi:hypothetical protein